MNQKEKESPCKDISTVLFRGINKSNFSYKISSVAATAIKPFTRSKKNNNLKIK
jgi:hypothetical protein